MASPVLVNGSTGVSSTAIFVRPSCNIVGGSIFNASNATAYVQLFDTEVAPTVGTTVPNWSVGVTTLGQSQPFPLPPAGLFFAKGLWIAATTGVLTGAPNAALVVNLAMS